MGSSCPAGTWTLKSGTNTALPMATQPLAASPANIKPMSFAERRIYPVFLASLGRRAQACVDCQAPVLPGFEAYRALRIGRLGIIGGLSLLGGIVGAAQIGRRPFLHGRWQARRRPDFRRTQHVGAIGGEALGQLGPEAAADEGLHMMLMSRLDRAADARKKLRARGMVGRFRG